MTRDDDILDYEPKKNTSTIYSSVGLYGALLVYLIIGIMLIKMPKVIRPSEPMWEPFFIVIWIARSSATIGVLATIMSYVKNEPLTWIKRLATILNTIVGLAFIFAVIYFNLIIGDIR